ncbi:hypothetical protein E4K10_30160 [Streptomyces sp. T1317-0309]|nr:hypothetical protein E4K10_30160 [Streptomyces sp. T1317-0309]
MSDALTKLHVRKVLEANARYQDDFDAKVKKLEAAGHRVFDGGQDGGYDDNGSSAPWKVTDWRTGEVIASGQAPTRTIAPLSRSWTLTSAGS